MKPKQRFSMWVIGALAGAGGVLAAYHYGPKTARVDVPVSRARVADFTISVRARGEMRSLSSDIITAPQLAGLRIVKLTEAGTPVKGGDVVAEFENAPEEAAERRGQWKREFGKTVVRAPHDGIISILPDLRGTGAVGLAASPFKKGDRVWAGAAIAELSDPAKMQLEFKLEEVDRGKVQLKQPVKVRVDAMPERELLAKLDWISPIASIAFKGLGLTEKTFLAHAALQKTDKGLKPGMPGSAEIVIENRPGQLLIPVRAGMTQDGRPAVYLQTGDEFIVRAIEVGKRNDTDLVVLKGLKEGDAVALEDPAATVKRVRKPQ